jgi:DNA-binding NarL/FixJ family response regulator
MWEVLVLVLGLLKRHAKFVDLFNAKVAPLARPLAASEVQQSKVLALHQDGKSLRWIAEATGLGLRTVRTITGKADGTDRTTAKREKLRRTPPPAAAAE